MQEKLENSDLCKKQITSPIVCCEKILCTGEGNSNEIETTYRRTIDKKEISMQTMENVYSSKSLRVHFF